MGRVYFKITIHNSLFLDTTYSLSNISLFDGESIGRISESNLKKYLIPFIREVKLNLIGI